MEPEHGHKPLLFDKQQQENCFFLASVSQWEHPCFLFFPKNHRVPHCLSLRTNEDWNIHFNQPARLKVQRVHKRPDSLPTCLLSKRNSLQDTYPQVCKLPSILWSTGPCSRELKQWDKRDQTSFLHVRRNVFNSLPTVFVGTFNVLIRKWPAAVKWPLQRKESSAYSLIRIDGCVGTIALLHFKNIFYACGTRSSYICQGGFSGRADRYPYLWFIILRELLKIHTEKKLQGFFLAGRGTA